MTSPPLTNREYAYLKITGPGSHEQVTEVIGLRPSEAWNVGDVNPRNGKPRNFMSWRLSSGLEDTQTLDAHIETLLLQLQNKANAIRSLWIEHDLTLQCVGYFPPSGHGMHFNRELYSNGSKCSIGGRLYHRFTGNKGNCGACTQREKCLRTPDKTEVRQVSFLIKEQKSAVSFIEIMKRAIDSVLGRKLYGQRMGTVEPVFGNLRYNKGLDRFTLRGLAKVNTQWHLFCLVHNIEKLAHGGYGGR